MNHFSIKDIERMSGIKAHTLRIWEQRHGLRFCKRKASLHRYYDNEDLKQILRIAYLYHNGYKISRIATLSPDEVKSLAITSIGDNSYDIFINQMIEASIDYDQPRFERVIHNALLHLGFERTVVNVFYPFMEKIGLLWITDHVIPAQEHFSSYLIQKRIIIAIDGLDIIAKDNDQIVLIFSPEGELHEIPLLVMQYILRKHGIKTVYLGCNICLKELVYYCKHKPVTHLYFHLITNFIHKEPEEYLKCLQENLGSKNIIASGPALRDVLVTGIRIIRSLEEMMEMNETLGLSS
ncbi:MAG: MerR family transcriptional regulator [Chitinophagaceae bacterium]